MLKNDGSPLYMQLKNDLYDRVSACEWRAGQMLPSENELVHMYEVSRITVRQALAELQRDGIVVKKQGKGTFVNPQPAVHRLGSMYTFNRELHDMGLRTSMTLLDWKESLATPRLVSNLQLGDDRSILELLRLRFTEDKPLAIEHSYLPRSLVGNLSRDSVEQIGLYNSLSEQCLIVPQQATETLSAVLLTAQQADYLQAKEGAAAFHLQRISQCRGQVVEYSSCFIRGDRYKLTFNLK